MGTREHIYQPDSFWGAAFAYDGRRMPKMAAEIVAYLVKSDAMGRWPDMEYASLTPRAQRTIPLLEERGLVRRRTDVRGVSMIELCGLNERVRPCRMI